MPVRRLSALLSPAALACFLLTAIIGIVLDQWTKVRAWSHLLEYLWWDRGIVHTRSSIYPFIPGWLHFEVTANQGAVFGVGQGRRLLFIAVSIAAIAFIFYLFSVSGRQHVYQVILGMLLAGVIGNLYDRVQFHYVRDMIHALPNRHVFHWQVFPYIFNVADTLLCMGVGLMILHSLFQSAKEAQARRK